MTGAYHAGSALEAEAALLALAKELDRTQPGAAASLCEGLDETRTVLRLGVPPTLARTLRSTNCIESMISVCRRQAMPPRQRPPAPTVAPGRTRSRDRRTCRTRRAQ
jgi:transposase-like protein